MHAAGHPSLNTDNDYGLTTAEVQQAQRRFGRNELALHRTSFWNIFFRQFNSPLLVILMVTTVVSFSFGDHTNAAIIFGIMTLSVVLGLVNEYSSEKTVTDLLKKVSLSALVIRNGIKQEIPVSEVAVGDLVLLHQGTVVPADVKLLESLGLTIDESSLTGESLPTVKRFDSPDAKLNRANMGTVVMSGCGRGLVQAIAGDTEFGRLFEGATRVKERTTFQKGLASLGSLMTKVIVVMALLICVLNIALGRDPLQSVLFALAVAIGLTPALLPVIVTISMARGAHRMAKLRVVVKRLVSIEDLGNMDVLCTDKTGTLTEGTINLTGFYTMRGAQDPHILELALACNTASHHHRVLGNPMDVAIWQYAIAHRVKHPSIEKLAEEEFNYDYRGQYTVVKRGSARQIIFKGAADSVLDRCQTYEDATGQLVPINADRRSLLREQFRKLNQDGIRLIVIGQRRIEAKEEYSHNDAVHLELMGYLCFLDVPKPSAKHALETLAKLGVAVKILTGDNELVTDKICHDIGLDLGPILTGPNLARMTPHQLEKAAQETNVFARVTPEQKEAIILALKKSGHTVGYLGDGVNDAGALHAADVGMSVNTAVDVAKDLASVVLLEKGLDVIAEGVKEGRRIFANTIKYILMGTSSNFGNMFSVAGASFFLPFLPMTPSQILLNNSFYDIFQIGIPSDEVDAEQLMKPHHWDIKHIYRYMLFFGPISSIFDYVSFGLLWYWLHATESQFQTGWFLESIATQVLVVFVIRTARVPFFKSRPGRSLQVLCFLVLVLAFALPFSPVGGYLHLVALPPLFFVSLLGLIITYLAIVEFVKSRFLRRDT
ncbi:MAG: magnesium-translocating P-type ATPase [bacterium]